MLWEYQWHFTHYCLFVQVVAPSNAAQILPTLKGLYLIFYQLENTVIAHLFHSCNPSANIPVPFVYVIICLKTLSHSIFSTRCRWQNGQGQLLHLKWALWQKSGGVLWKRQHTGAASNTFPQGKRGRANTSSSAAQFWKPKIGTSCENVIPGAIQFLNCLVNSLPPYS